MIAASLKAQGAAFRQRQVIPPAGAITLDEADDDLPSLLPPGVCNSDAEDDNNPPVEASIASRAGRRGQGTSLLSYANQVALRVLPSIMKYHAELAVDLAESIDSITSGDPGSNPTPFLPEASGLYKVLKQPVATRRPWIKSLVKELKGLVKDRGAFNKDFPVSMTPWFLSKKCSSASLINTAMLTSSRPALFSVEIYTLRLPTLTAGIFMPHGLPLNYTSPCGQDWHVSVTG